MVDATAQRSRSRMLLASGIACLLHAPVDLYLAAPSDWLTLLAFRAGWLGCFVLGALLVLHSSRQVVHDVALHALAGVSALATGFVVMKTGGTSSPVLLWFPLYPALAALVVPFDLRTVGVMAMCSVVAAGAVPLLDPTGSLQVAWTVVAVTALSGFISVAGVVSARRRRTEELELRAEKVRVEEALRLSEVAREQLERSVRLKQLATIGDVTSGLAEELRGAAQALRIALERAGEDRTAIRDAATVGSRIETLVSEVLGASQERLTGGNADVEQVAEAARRLTRPVWGPTHELVVTAPPVPVHVGLARGPLLQVLVNLLANAVQATPYGGRIELSISVVEAGVRILVDDDGPGIPATDREQVFRPYTGDNPEGAGLGLSLCRAYVTEAGGTIQATAAPSGGARIEVLLPRASAQAALTH